MNNLDQILGLQNNSTLKPEITSLAQNENESKRFEGVMEEQWNNNISERKALSKSRKEKKDKSEDAVSSKDELKSKETKKESKEENKIEEKNEDKNTSEEETQVLNKTQNADSEEADKIENKEVSVLQEQDYLALLLKDYLQTPTPVVPNAALSAEELSVGEEDLNLSENSNAEIAIEFGAAQKANAIAQPLPNPAQDLSQNLKVTTAEEKMSQILEKSKMSQEDILAKIQLQRGEQKPLALENQKEVSPQLMQEIKSTQQEKNSTPNNNSLASEQSGSAKIDLKDLLKVSDKVSVSLEEDFSFELSQATQNLNSDKVTLSGSPLLSLSKEAFAVNNSLPADNVNKSSTQNFKQEDVSSIHKQLVDSLQVSVKAKEDRAELQLSPPDWGRIKIQMNVENKNELKVHMIAENPDVRQLLERSTYDLKQAMASGGLGFSNINVGVGNGSSSTWKEKQEQMEQGIVDKVIKKQVAAPTAYRWINSQASGVDQLV